MLKTVEKLLLYLFILAFPSQLSFHFWPSFSLLDGFRVDYLSPVIYFTDFLIIGLLLLGWLNKRTLLIKKIKLSPIRLLLLFMAVTNILFSLSPLLTLYKFLRLSEYLLLCLYLIDNKQLFLKSFSKILPLTISWVCLLVFWQSYLQHSVGGFWFWLGERYLTPTMLNVAKTTVFGSGILLRPYATFSHPNALAGFIAVSLFVLVYFQKKQLTSKKLFIWALGLGICAMLLTFSHTALIVSAIFMLLLFKNKRFRILILLSLLLLIYWSAGILDTISFSERILLFSKATQSVISHPLFGIGLGNFPLVRTPPSFSNSFLNIQPVHNIYLLLSAELGLSFFGLVTYFSIKYFYRIWPKVSPELRFSLITILALGLVDHYWITSNQNLLMLVFLLVLTTVKFIPGKYAE